MPTKNLAYRDWLLEADAELTRQTYATATGGGADTCVCNDCKNYVVYRERIFPAEVRALFTELGIDYRKEVETFRYQLLPTGLHHVGGWFHFKGRVLAGRDFWVALPSGGFTGSLTPITDTFALGFTAGSDLTFFADKTGLAQVEFEAHIPWVINKALETGD